MHADESYIIRALAAGARAYLLKDATDEDLLPALRAVAAGKHFFSPAVTSVLVENHVRALQKRGLTDPYDLLTDREKEVLHLLARAIKRCASEAKPSRVQRRRLDRHATAQAGLAGSGEWCS